MKKILVTGAAVYLGNSIYEKYKNDYNITQLTRSVCDLTDYNQVKNFFHANNFDIVVHCAVQGGNRLISENFSIMDKNLMMYYNLLDNRNKFDRFIHIGSGAEFSSELTPYGLSKKVISKSMEEKENFFDLKIFAVFDENELDRRFIKSALLNYINKEPIVINTNKKMDFIYLPDFLNIVGNFFKNDLLPKNLNCVYENKQTLLEIAEFINKLSHYNVPIQIQNYTTIEDYIGEYNPIISNFNILGLEQGIKNVYFQILKTMNL